jgi:hypothetical protein
MRLCGICHFYRDLEMGDKMNITIERLMAKVGNLSVVNDLLVEENVVLREAAKVKEAIKAEIAKLESEGKTDIVEILTRLKALL